jgi:hypothetical protein
VSAYVRRKGINSADQVEIQFYLNQLEKQAGGQLSDKEKIRFIAGARKELRRQLNLSQKEKNSEVNLSKENFTTREGLHMWVIRWAEKEAHIKKHPAYLL